MAVEFKYGQSVKDPMKLSPEASASYEGAPSGTYKETGPYVSEGAKPHDSAPPFTAMHNPAVSAAQARLFGAMAGGEATKAKGMTRAEAKEALKGQKLGGLPARK